MHRKKRSLPLFILSLIFVPLFIYLLLSFSPDSKILILNFAIPANYLFLTLLFLSIFSFAGYLFDNKGLGFLLGLFTIVYLVLRLIGLSDLFFFIILSLLFMTLGFLFIRK